MYTFNIKIIKFNIIVCLLYNLIKKTKKGFRIIWNEIQIVAPSSIQHYCESSYLFRCEITGFCITDKLRCDGTKNCGPGDDTDEMHCES